MTDEDAIERYVLVEQERPLMLTFTRRELLTLEAALVAYRPPSPALVQYVRSKLSPEE